MQTAQDTECPTHGPMRVTDLRMHKAEVAASCKFCLQEGLFSTADVRIVNGKVVPK